MGQNPVARPENPVSRPEWIRKHGFSAEPIPVSAYVGSSKNLKDLKERAIGCSLVTAL